MYQRIILLILFPLFGFSQAPQKINFQSILRNSSGEVVANQSVSLKISILSGSIGGSAAYSETHTKTTDPSGLISLQIGNGTVLSGVFANISWGDFPHFIKLEADLSGGNNYVLLGTQELMSVPYALYASKTDTSSLNLVNRFNSKVNVSDTSLMLNPYLRKADAIVNVETDPVFNSSVAKGITGIDTAYWNRKLNLTDTSSMLTNYRTGLNNKVNIADTASMLANYKTIITDLQKQVELLSSYTSLLASGLVDIDGNNYPVVKIGNQIWMKENLRVSRYRNGDVIPIVNFGSSDYITTGTRTWYNNDSTTYEIPYGNLYDGYAASDNRNICPTGWHVPSDSEWTVLTDYLGGESVAGGKMKVTGTTYWNSPNAGATNESGFSALPGLGVDFGNDLEFEDLAYFYSSTKAASIQEDFVWIRFLYSFNDDIDRNFNGITNMASIRCLRD